MSQKNNIFDKLSCLKEYKLDPQSPYIYCDFDGEYPDEKEIADFKKKYCFIDEQYLSFLREFGSPRISWLEILPIRSEETSDIAYNLQSLKEYWTNSEGYLPFAKDAGTYIYCFNQQGEVWGFLIGGYAEKPDFFAHSFEEFLNDYLLGKKYADFADIDDDEFYDFIKKQGWV